MTTVAVIFWVSISLVVYSYLIYPIMLGLVAQWVKLFPRYSEIDQSEIEWPRISLIIAAYKEEQVILQRVQNALLLDYPADRIEILIGVDGDLDSTGEIVKSIPDDRVRLMQFPERRGKASVLNDCVVAAAGDVLLFSDANTFWDSDAAKRLVQHFVHNSVGGVCGRLILTDSAEGGNCDGLYWRYENRLKEWEGEIGALLGANGAIYAVRKSLYQPIPPHTIVDDFLIGMRIHEQSHDLVYDQNAIAREETAPTIQHEFQRRSRIGAGGFQSLVWLSRLLNPAYGRVSWAFWSHKVLRWTCPLWLAIALGTNISLVSEGAIFQWMLGIQIAFYAVSILGAFVKLPGPSGKLARVAWMFVNMNLALANGFRRWAFQKQTGTWKRTERTEEGAVMQSMEPAVPAGK